MPSQPVKPRIPAIAGLCQHEAVSSEHGQISATVQDPLKVHASLRVSAGVAAEILPARAAGKGAAGSGWRAVVMKRHRVVEGKDHSR